MAPNSEVMHTLKSGLLCSNGRLKVGQNLLIYSGIPFTPEVVTTDPPGDAVLVQDEYNSAIDHVPRFDMSLFATVQTGSISQTARSRA